MKMCSRNFLHAILLAVFLLAVLTQAQDQSGFISIDCGIPAGSRYNDEKTDLKYISDTLFTETGINKNISSELRISTLPKQFHNVRSFPQGTRNCYSLNPTEGKGSKYLIRASFMYGNYDAANKPPQFDLYLGVNLWESIKVDNVSAILMKEIIHIPTSNDILICLVNTGLGTPFMSALELRLLRNSSYETPSQSMVLYARYDYGSITNQTVRYKDDAYDRIWSPREFPRVRALSTSLPIRLGADDSYVPPSAVMKTAIMPINDSQPLELYWEPKDPTAKYYVYMYFAEVEELNKNQTREFNITQDGDILMEFIVPEYLFTFSTYRQKPYSGARINFSLNKTDRSTLPPILNALEVYMEKDFLQSETIQADVDAAIHVKKMYRVKRNWQGDPCAPKAYSWVGLSCSYQDSDPPRIISVNLSSSGLTGEIAPYFSNLTMIQSLDLSNNSLSGKVPEFLSRLQSLKVLNLKGNKFTGPIPVELLEKSKNGSLQLSVGDNPDDCSSPSNTCKKEKKNTFVVPLVASAVALLVVIIVLTFIWRRLKRRNGQAATHGGLEFENRQFTYSEVLRMTDNFNKVLGKGGFGTVYHGYMDDGTQVAVKMLSSSSGQGFKEFEAEVKLLMRVHHRNLTNLVGYCIEDSNMGLLYEYMANGNLQQRLSDEKAGTLSWEERLRIAMDAAQGLEYLHQGCKPPIVHRDIKSPNILLTENHEAKLADFGLSKVFPVGGTHVSTVVAGTPGYLDPEYFVTDWLNEKSDVYSFGVLLLEIITSRAVIVRKETESIHIIQTVTDMIENGDIENIVDPSLSGDFEIESAWKAVELALQCASRTSAKRPNMNEVVTELKECLMMELARKKRTGGGNEPHFSSEMISVNLETV